MKLVILDRDGVINEESEDYIRSVDEFMPYPESLEAIAMLTQAGVTVAVATNQSGVSRRYFSEETLTQIHEKMCYYVERVGGRIDHIEYCMHLPLEGCMCRKPQPGLLNNIYRHYGMKNTRWVPFVGDSYRDVQAAFTSGSRPSLVQTGYGLKTRRRLHTFAPHAVDVYRDLKEFAVTYLEAIEKGVDFREDIPMSELLEKAETEGPQNETAPWNN